MSRWYFDRWGRDTLQTVGTIAQPSRITERRAYDLLGQQIYRDRRSQAFSGGGGILMDSLFYDHRGKIGGVWTSSRSLGTERYSIHYDGLGALVASLSDNGSAYSLEEFRNDAYGNVLYSRTRSSAHGDRLPSRSTYMGKGHLNRRWTPTLPGSPPPQIKYEDLHQEYVGDNLRSSASVTYDPNEEDYKNYAGTRHYYDGENRLAALQRYTGFPAYMDPVSGWYWSTDGTFEEYRYDALGRRVMTQVRRAASPPSGKVQLCEAYYSPTNCRSYLEHTWWAGDQMFEESRTPIGPSDASNSGTVRYVHGPGIDRPLAVLAGSTHIVNYTWRGLGESSLTPTGAAGDCSLGGGGGCTLIDWPVDRGVYFTKFYASSGPQPVYKWMGTLTANGGSGTTGLLYRRNRYYDSETGRWTQEDPIGIAGGINVFGFAAGDPVNYSDPFGLCPEFITGRPCSNAVAIGVGFVPVLGDAYDIVSAVIGKDLLTGEKIDAVGIGATIIGTAFGSGKLAREGTDVARRLARGPGRLTNAQASELAAHVGYNRRVKDAPFNSHGQPVFTDGKNYITPDFDSHNGGVWKVFDRRGRRVGTVDALMNPIVE